MIRLMVRWSVTQRLRVTLGKLLERHGEAAALARFSQNRPGGARISAQDLTYFIQHTPGRKNPIGLDDLDDIADYFRVSIGDLFGVKKQDLTGDEQRLLWSFRALSNVTQEQFLALLESASVSSNYFVTFRKGKDLKRTAEAVHTLGSTSEEIESHATAAARVPLSVEVAALAAELDDLSKRIALHEAGAVRPDHSAIADRLPPTAGDG